MKALTEKYFLLTNSAHGAIGASDQWHAPAIAQFDYADLAPPPSLRCASHKCRNAGTCTIGMACLASPTVRVEADGSMGATGRPVAVE